MSSKNLARRFRAIQHGEISEITTGRLDTTDDVRYNDPQFVQRAARLVFAIKPFADLDVVHRRRTWLSTAPRCVAPRRQGRSARARMPISIEMANDNFSVSSQLIYDVPVMEETCDDWRISTSNREGKKVRDPQGPVFANGKKRTVFAHLD